MDVIVQGESPFVLLAKIDSIIDTIGREKQPSLFLPVELKFYPICPHCILQEWGRKEITSLDRIQRTNSRGLPRIDTTTFKTIQFYPNNPNNNNNNNNRHTMCRYNHDFEMDHLLFGAPQSDGNCFFFHSPFC